MGKQLFIAEKPSVAAEFAKALKVNGGRRDGYLESDQYVVTWCVGHLITMSYPEVYDPALKKWSLNTIPFFPEEWKYEVIGSVKKQFAIVKGLLNRADVDTIYICRSISTMDGMPMFFMVFWSIAFICCAVTA